jgi:hypothetical protein
MTRINALRNFAETRSMTWGKNTSALIFAAVLIVCSVTVGCSSDKPKPVSSNNQIPVTQQAVTQPESPISPMPTPAAQAATKPATKKVVHKRPATVNYTDKTYGLTFEYPRRYAIETGSAASELLASNPLAMNFVQPGGVALAAVELPETGFANTDFSSAFFNVSVHKTLTADQCSEFAVPQPKIAAAATQPTSEVQTPAPSSQSASVQPGSAPNSKLMIGDLELRATEAVSGEGTRQSDSKYFHAFQNGACYEFALNVTTVASEDGVTKHVDRDKIFDRLEKILATVKINPVAAPEVTAEAPAQTPAVTPAQ